VERTNWRQDLAKGVLSHAALAALAPAPGHGYELLARLNDRGFDRLKGGTLYPLLHRLESQSLISHHWTTPAAGPARKVYTITDTGLAELDEAERAWSQVDEALRSLRHGGFDVV
jgi:PadR family transcriptional regulator PadR